MRHKKFSLLALLAVLVMSVFASSAAAAPLAEDDDEVVLPSRVANPIHRAQLSLDRAIGYVDDGDKAKAVVSLKAMRASMLRADKAARKQMAAVAVDPEDTEEPETPEGAPEAPEDHEVPEAPEAPDAEDTETTPGPDSVVAVLSLDTEIVTTLSGLFDTKQGIIVDGLSPALFAILNARDRLLTTVIALDPEGAGADYADVMADIAGDFDDEVANITEATQDDALSVGGRKVLVKALAQSKATQARVAAAFGGGE